MRIVQACRKLGLEFVCVHTAEDIHSGHVRIAKELGGEKSLYQVSSYHDANEILSVADDAGATAIHPGYGFFAEDFRFARRVTTRERKLIFIGPSWRVIRELGDKINTKRLARSLGVPTVTRFRPPHLRRNGSRKNRQEPLRLPAPAGHHPPAGPRQGFRGRRRHGH